MAGWQDNSAVRLVGSDFSAQGQGPKRTAYH